MLYLLSRVLRAPLLMEMFASKATAIFGEMSSSAGTASGVERDA